jgi:hypothetical protein
MNGQCVVANAGGSAGAGGGGWEAGLAAGSGGNTVAPAEAGDGKTAERCTGCLKLSVPLTEAGQVATVDLGLANPVDMSASIITCRMQVAAGLGGGFLLFGINGAATNYAGDYGYSNLAALSPGTGLWQMITLDVSSYVVDVDAGMAFDKTKVANVRFQINATTMPSTWANPTVIYVDEIRISDGVAGPYTFDNDAMAAVLLPLAGPVPQKPPPLGTTLTWVGP